MDKTTKEQVNSSFESPLWQEVSDEAADACVGGAQGDLKQLLKDIIFSLGQRLWWFKRT